MSEQSSRVKHVVNEELSKPWQSTLQEFGRALQDTTFVVIDLETTGGAPHLGAAITEIGAIKSRGGQLLGEFKTFVDPGHLVPAYITELTGITDEMLFQSPKIELLLPQLFEFLGAPRRDRSGCTECALDLSFLTFATRESGLAWPAYPVLDTAIIARKVLTRDEVPNCKLSTLAEFFGTKTTPNHRALDDARATLDVFHGLLERLGSLDIHTLEELLNFSKRTKRPKSPESRQPID